MKLLFMLCNNCMYLCTQSKNWLVDHKNCTCIFIEPMPLHGVMPVLMVQHEAAKQAAEWIREAVKHMSQEELERFCFENGFTVPEKK